MSVHEGPPSVNELLDQDKPQISVTRITEGLAFGEGAISGDSSDPEALILTDEAIHNSDKILVPVDVKDDGCSDGRETTLVFTASEVFKRNLNRAKVFGGAVAMTAATLIGLGRGRNKQLQSVFEEAIDTLVQKKISFGAHTAEHAPGEDCGCGAIDRAPEAMLAALKYETPIRSVITVLGVNSEGLDEVYDNFRRYARENFPQQATYSGRGVMKNILAAGKVVKKLGGEHREKRIVLNRVRGYTVNQKLIRLVTGGQVQVFGVDTWRLEDIAIGLFPGQPSLQHKALLSQLVYTIATAAVLTKGDLPVDMIEELSPAQSIE